MRHQVDGGLHANLALACSGSHLARSTVAAAIAGARRGRSWSRGARRRWKSAACKPKPNLQWLVSGMQHSGSGRAQAAAGGAARGGG